MDHPKVKESGEESMILYTKMLTFFSNLMNLPLVEWSVPFPGLWPPANDIVGSPGYDWSFLNEFLQVTTVVSAVTAIFFAPLLIQQIWRDRCIRSFRSPCSIKNIPELINNNFIRGYTKAFANNSNSDSNSNSNSLMEFFKDVRSATNANIGMVQFSYDSERVVVVVSYKLAEKFLQIFSQKGSPTSNCPYLSLFKKVSLGLNVSDTSINWQLRREMMEIAMSSHNSIQNSTLLASSASKLARSLLQVADGADNLILLDHIFSNFIFATTTSMEFGIDPYSLTAPEAIKDVLLLKSSSTKEHYELQLHKASKSIWSHLMDLQAIDDDAEIPLQDLPERSFGRLLIQFHMMHKFPENHITAEIFNFLYHAVESTAHCLSWFFFCLSRYPLVRDKVHIELNQFNHQSNCVQELFPLPPFCEAVLRESMRKFPVNKFANLRQVEQDLTISISDEELSRDTRDLLSPTNSVVSLSSPDTPPSKLDARSIRSEEKAESQTETNTTIFHFPAGTWIGCFPFIMNLSRLNYQDDPMLFLPERWLDSTGQKLLDSSEAFYGGLTEHAQDRVSHTSGSGMLPFSIGKRSCVGSRYALILIRSVILALTPCLKFDLLHLDSDENDQECNLSTLLKPKDRLPVRVQRSSYAVKETKPAFPFLNPLKNIITSSPALTPSRSLDAPFPASAPATMTSASKYRSINPFQQCNGFGNCKEGDDDDKSCNSEEVEASTGGDTYGVADRSGDLDSDTGSDMETKDPEIDNIWSTPYHTLDGGMEKDSDSFKEKKPRSWGSFFTKKKKKAKKGSGLGYPPAQHTNPNSHAVNEI